MRYIYLLLFLFACAEDSELQKQDCELMIISDSLPFKFWQDGKSFNTRQICGVNPQCYCAPWICDREIRLQVKDTINGQNVELQIIDENETVLKTLQFDEFEDTTSIDLQFGTTDFPSSLGDWASANGSNRGNGTGSAAWSYFDGGAYVSGGSIWKSRYLQTQRTDDPTTGWPPGNYVISVTIDHQTSGSGAAAGEIKIYGMPSSASQTLITSSASGTFPVSATTTRTISFTLDQYWPYLAVSFDLITGVNAFNFQATIDDIHIVSVGEYNSTIYDLSFTPSEISPDICNKKVYFKIVGNTEEYLTDCIDIRDSFPEKCLKEIIYSNSKNFDNISYEDFSPAPQFRKIVEAQFWKEDNPQEQEDSVLSNGVIVTRRSEIQEKTLFETGYLPNYEHKKLQKIFMHNYVVIEDVTGEEIQWKKRDAYETENLNRYPLKRAQVWLTKYNSVEKNTI